MAWDVILQIGEFALSVFGIIFGATGIYYWRAYKKEKEANAQAAAIDAKQKEADLAESILEKYEKAILARMDSGETVRKKEFQELEGKIDRRFDEVNNENSKQNGLLRDIVEFLNGDFQEFEKKKKGKTKKESAEK